MIGHVLLDADGVLQSRPGGWLGPLVPLLGDRAEAFLTEVMASEEAGLHGREDFVAALGAIMVDFGLTVPPAELYAAELWLTIGVDETMLELVESCAPLASGSISGPTNNRRAAYMRKNLGYDDLFDESFYSCELGVAKPAAGFFQAAVRTIGVDPSEVLFVDDLAVNVAGARDVGLVAEQWTLADGLPVLRARLVDHGLLAS